MRRAVDVIERNTKMQAQLIEDLLDVSRIITGKLNLALRPVSLAVFDRTRPGWMTSDEDLWWIAEHLVGVPHTPLLTPTMVRHLTTVGRRSLRAGLVGYRRH